MYEYSAKTKSTPTRVFHIWSEKYTQNGVPMNGWSWCFYVGEIDSAGNEEPIYDGWDTEFEIILMYPEKYTDEELVWSDPSGKIVDLNELKRKLSA